MDLVEHGTRSHKLQEAAFMASAISEKLKSINSGESGYRGMAELVDQWFIKLAKSLGYSVQKETT